MTTSIHNHTKGFFITPNDFLDKWLRIIGPGAFIVYLELNRFCRGGEHIPFPTVTMLDWAAWVGMSYPSFTKHITTLEKHGLINITRSRNKSQFTKESNKYEILSLPEVSVEDIKGIKRFQKEIRFGDPLQGESMFKTKEDSPYKNSLACEPQTSLGTHSKNVEDNKSTSKNNSTKKEFFSVAKESFDPEDLPRHLGKHPALVKAWLMFVQHRIAKKKPLNKISYTVLINKMLRHAPDEIVKELHKSIECGWPTIFYSDNESSVKDPPRPSQPTAPLDLYAQELFDFVSSVVDGCTPAVTQTFISQLKTYYDRTDLLRDPDDKNRGPLAHTTWKTFSADWLEFLREKQDSFPLRGSYDLKLSGTRWQEFIKRWEYKTDYDFTTGKRIL